MIELSSSEVASLCDGKLFGPGKARITRWQTDTRQLLPGDCFVALRGERFDGHDFVSGLNPAVVPLVIIEQGRVTSVPAGIEFILVPDTTLALQKAAAAWRARLPVRVTGVTGSAGKTSTKELIASVLRQSFRTHATVGNLNNHLGVPLTLLALHSGVECAVVEMGMNHPGEIAPLASWSQPSVGVITGIGTAHIEFFPNQEGIAIEKSALIESLSSDGVAVLNADDPWTPFIARRTQARVVLAGFSQGADWRAVDVAVTTSGMSFRLHHQDEEETVTLPVFGRMMVNNALLAAAVGGEHGLSLKAIAQGLSTVSLPGARMRPEPWNGGWVIADYYNANAESMVAALRTLNEFPGTGRRGAILGSMGELGTRGDELHETVGRCAAEHSLDWLITVGPHASSLARGARGVPLLYSVADAADVARLWRALAQTGDIVLLKGSRFMKLERVLDEMNRTEEIQ